MNDMPKNQKVSDSTGQQAELTTFFPSKQNEHCGDCGVTLEGKTIRRINGTPYCRECWQGRVGTKRKQEA
jgi:hypothetical protein